MIAGLALWGDDSMAGAWPRGDGKSFTSFSLETEIDGDGSGVYASLFFEYGLTSRLTLGVDAGRDLATSDVSAIVFLRYPVFDSGGPNKFAFELGVGSTDLAGQGTFTVRPGLSWGRGYEALWGSGWMGVESTYAIRADGSELGKVDATFGVSHDSGSLSIFQLQYEHPSGNRSALSIAPAHVFKLSETTFLELGARHRFRDSETLAKVGFWLSF